MNKFKEKINLILESLDNNETDEVIQLMDEIKKNSNVGTDNFAKYLKEHPEIANDKKYIDYAFELLDSNDTTSGNAIFYLIQQNPELAVDDRIIDYLIERKSTEGINKLIKFNEKVKENEKVKSFLEQ